MKQNKWQIYQRNGIHYFTLSLIPINKKNYSQLVGYNFGRFFYSTEGEHITWVYEKEWLFKKGGKLAKNLFEKAGMRKFHDKWQSYSDNCDSVSKKLDKLNLKKISYSDLSLIFQELISNTLPFMVFTVLTLDFLDEVIFYDLKKELEKKVKNNFDEIFIKVTTAIEPTYLAKMDLAFLKIVKAIKNNDKSAGIFKSENITKIDKYLKANNRINRMIEDFLNQYWWARLGWAPQAAITKNDVMEEIIIKSRKKENIDKEINNYKNFSKETKKEKDKIIKNYGLNSGKFKKLLKLFEDMAVYHDRRKEIQVKMVYSAFQVLKELSRRDKRLIFEDLLWYSYEDLKNYFNNEVLIKKGELEKRKKNVLRYSDNKKTFVLFGKKAEQKRMSLLGARKSRKDIKEFSGVVAFKGKAKGRVKLSHNAKELNRIISIGDILVTSMTTPDFAPAMKKAAAIITDEGGITCHAAIIARELKIPCIIGTEIATRVLRSGDVVEVDADRGIVKIIR